MCYFNILFLGMFVLLVNYKKPLEEVEQNLEAHRAYLDKYYALHKFIFSGRRNPRTGGCILCRAKDEAEVREIMQEDPFYFKGIADYEIIDITLTKYAPGFDKFL